MSELNFELLQENIRNLMKNNEITQQELAEVAGMSQANVSKALNPGEKKKFTIDQLFRIAQHFGVSIDDLTGNKAASDASTSPRAVCALLSKLLCEAKVKASTLEVEEVAYEPCYNEQGYPDYEIEKKKIQYPVFYFPDYNSVWDFAREEHEAEDVHFAFMSGGNDTKFKPMNEIMNQLIPIVKLYRENAIPEDAFQMILDGYLEKLAGK